MKERKGTNRRAYCVVAGVVLLAVVSVLFILNADSHDLRRRDLETPDPISGATLERQHAIEVPSYKSSAGGLLNANPMVGRPTADGATITLKAGPSPIAISLQLCPETADRRWCASDPWTMEFVTWRASQAVAHGLAVQVRREGKDSNKRGRTLNLLKREFVEIDIIGLEEATSYKWFLQARELPVLTKDRDATRRESYSGRFVTQRPAKASTFTFNIFADPHLFSEQFSEQFLTHPDHDSMRETFYAQKQQVEKEFLRVASNMNEDRPDFVIGLGDPFDLHGLGFVPAMAKEEANQAHAHARSFLSLLNETGALFQVVGNWEGESGCHPPEARQHAINARLKYQINPRPGTYAEWEGSEFEDYYAFSWGDMLVLVLNVLGYDETCHQMGQVFGSKRYGNYKSFTLGAQQQKFAERTLSGSRHAYKLVFIHHALGGRSRDPVNSDYGRGGYLAAKIGEQRWLHELMVETGVQIMFYGHDHVFTDALVDTVHYTLPGTSSAPWRFSGDDTGYTHFNTTSGHARVFVTPKEMTVEFVSIEKKVFYSYQVKPSRPPRAENNNP